MLLSRTSVMVTRASACKRQYGQLYRALSTASAPASVNPHVAFGHSATLSISQLPTIKNEPMLSYAPRSTERQQLDAALDRLLNGGIIDVPIIINGKRYRTNKSDKPPRQHSPYDHKRTVATFHEADTALMNEAIRTSLAAKASWETLPWESRATIFLKAADLLTTKYRYDMLAAVIVGQGKNAWQAEIDSAAEMADFWRFNTKYAAQIYSIQPEDHSPLIWNRCEYRPLEGFIYAISPFNFAAIGGNLAGAPALMGNTVIWKPSPQSMLSAYLTMLILEEAGLPPGVINFVPADGPQLSSVLLASPHLGGIHFTGSTKTFQTLWKQVGERIDTYRSYPRLVGETGGKNFHFVHASADRVNVLNQTIRSAFEYSGQKCSACSRLYVPRSAWEGTQQATQTSSNVMKEFVLPSSATASYTTIPSLKTAFISRVNHIIEHEFGAAHQYSTFASAVIDNASYQRVKSALDRVKADKSGKAQIIVGGGCDDTHGYYIQPTIIVTTDPQYFTMTTELFGPVLTVYVYDDARFTETLQLCDATSPYALTGAIFASERYALETMYNVLRHSAGNFYVNDKCTGAVVGQQPFGGARGSGTNDKAGAMQNLLRWISVRAIKETFTPIEHYTYPSNKTN